MSGVITGGWSFVIAAYGLTALVLIVYTATVVARYRRERERVQRNDQ